MNIDISLSTSSINAAIRRLQKAKENLEYGLKQTVEILAEDGAAIAKADYGSMADAEAVHGADPVSRIVATGEAVVIAEFGAGDATMEPRFENYPGVDVYPGSYSEQVGTGEYAETGKWHFGGQVYTEVRPRAGLLDAREYIRDNAARIAKEVIEL